MRRKFLCARESKERVIGLGGAAKEGEERETRGRPLEGKKAKEKAMGTKISSTKKKTEARIIRIELNVSIRWWTITYRAREEAGIFRRNTRRWENEKETAMKHNLDIKR